MFGMLPWGRQFTCICFHPRPEPKPGLHICILASFDPEIGSMTCMALGTSSKLSRAAQPDRRSQGQR